MKSLILIRGLPGAGKSTLAKTLADDKWPVYSIDSYFTDSVTGMYFFEFDKNHLAYKNCEKQVERAMNENVSRIFVDNTFTLEWELEPYFRLASQFGYSVHTVTVENRHHSKNTHGISEQQIYKMAEKYKVVLF